MLYFLRLYIIRRAFLCFLIYGIFAGSLHAMVLELTPYPLFVIYMTSVYSPPRLYTEVPRLVLIFRVALVCYLRCSLIPSCQSWNTYLWPSGCNSSPCVYCKAPIVFQQLLYVPWRYICLLSNLFRWSPCPCFLFDLEGQLTLMVVLLLIPFLRLWHPIFS